MSVVESPVTARWKPARAGIRNVWEYDDQTFAFADGRLILRGPNGSGKSNALALLFPFLLDGTMSAAAMDPFAGGRSMRSLLLGVVKDDDARTGRFRHDQRLGYVWLELERADDDGTHHVTIGCGARATAQRDATSWFFVTPRRVGVDLDLAPGNEPLGRGRLIEALGADAVSDTAEDHRAAVDRALFGFGPDRHRKLVGLIRVLRRPQLAGKLDPELLSTVLSEGLAALSPTVLDDVAASLDDLEATQRELEELRLTRGVVDAFVPVYQRYLVNEAAERVGATLAAVQRRRRARRDRRDAQDDVEASEAALAANTEARRETDESHRVADAERVAVIESPAYRDATSLREVASAATTAEEAERGARHRRDEAHDAAAEAQREADAAATAAADAISDADRALTAVLDAADRADAPWTLSTDEAADPDLLESGARVVERARRDDVREVRRALEARAGAARDHGQAERAASESLAASDEAAAEAQRAADEVEAVRGQLRDAVTTWAETAPGLDGDGRTALVEAVDRLGRAGEPGLAVRYRALVGPEREALAAASARSADRLRLLAEQITALEAERKRIASEVDPGPEPPAWRRADRTGRPGAPLWACCDFAPGLSADEGAGLEAALAAAGLLDAWVGPGERDEVVEVDSEALDSWLIDSWLVASGPADEGPAGSAPHSATSDEARAEASLPPSPGSDDEAGAGASPASGSAVGSGSSSASVDEGGAKAGSPSSSASVDDGGGAVGGASGSGSGDDGGGAVGSGSSSASGDDGGAAALASGAGADGGGSIGPVTSARGGPTLAEVLVALPPEGSELTAQRVAGVLAGIGLGTLGVAVDRHGRFALGPLRGRSAQDAPQFIGATARAERRRRRLAEMDAEREELAHGVAEEEVEAERLAGSRAALEAAEVRAPSTVEVEEAEGASTAASSRAQAEVAVAERAGQAEARAAAVLGQLSDTLREVATQRRLEPSTEALDEVSELLGVLSRGVSRAVTDRRLADDRAARAEGDRLRAEAATGTERQREAEWTAASAEAASRRSRADTLQEQVGDQAEAAVARLARAEGAIEEARTEGRRLDAARDELSEAHGRAQRSVEAADEALTAAEDAVLVSGRHLDVLRRQDLLAVLVPARPGTVADDAREGSLGEGGTGEGDPGEGDPGEGDTGVSTTVGPSDEARAVDAPRPTGPDGDRTTDAAAAPSQIDPTAVDARTGAALSQVDPTAVDARTGAAPSPDGTTGSGPSSDLGRREDDLSAPDVSTTDVSAPDVPVAPEDFATWLSSALGRERPDEVELGRSRKALDTAGKRLLDDIHHSYDASIARDDEVTVVQVTSEGGTFPLARLAEELASGQEKLEQYLTEGDREVFERYLLNQVSHELRRLLVDAAEFVDGVNLALAGARTASGLTVELRWELGVDDTGVRDAVRLLRRDVTHLGADDLGVLRSFFERIIREQRAERPEAGYRSALEAALDYRSWHQFRPYLRTPTGGSTRLTRARFKELSGGEQAVSLHLPLFAAAAAHYDRAEPSAPRLIALDEAFAGIDEAMRGELMGLTVRFDLDVIMTGHELWGAYAEVPAVAIHDLLRRPPDEGVSVLSMRWDGAALTPADEDGDEPDESAGGGLGGPGGFRG